MERRYAAFGRSTEQEAQLGWLGQRVFTVAPRSRIASVCSVDSALSEIESMKSGAIYLTNRDADASAAPYESGLDKAFAKRSFGRSTATIFLPFRVHCGSATPQTRGRPSSLVR